jgi:hypothetical protein
MTMHPHLTHHLAAPSFGQRRRSLPRHRPQRKGSPPLKHLLSPTTKPQPSLSTTRGIVNPMSSTETALSPPSLRTLEPPQPPLLSAPGARARLPESEALQPPTPQSTATSSPSWPTAGSKAGVRRPRRRRARARRPVGRPSPAPSALQVTTPRRPQASRPCSTVAGVRVRRPRPACGARSTRSRSSSPPPPRPSAKGLRAFYALPDVRPPLLRGPRQRPLRGRHDRPRILDQQPQATREHRVAAACERVCRGHVGRPQRLPRTRRAEPHLSACSGEMQTLPQVVSTLMPGTEAATAR